MDGEDLLAQLMSNMRSVPGTEPSEGTPEAARLAQAMELVSDNIGEFESELARAESELAVVRASLAEDEGGLLNWFSDRIDSLGFGLGWWTMYFAILMPWMKGQTPGKRALKIRVVRLDGQSVTWWHAFERAGGYAAGLGTGTLGFAQIYWDPNRQGIHDKVGGTVVVVDGAAKVPGPWTPAESPVAQSPSTGSSATADTPRTKEG